MASKILNILCRTTQVSTEELLSGVIHATISAIETAETNYAEVDKSAMLEMIDCMCEIIDGQQSTVPKEEYLLHIVDDICLVLLPSIEASVYGSHSKHIGIDSQLHQSVSRLLSLCTVATPVTPSSVGCRLLKEYLSSLVAYKDEVEFSVVGDKRAHVIPEKHLSIQTTMKVIDILLDTEIKAIHHQADDRPRGITADWIQGCFNSILDMLHVCQANVCSHLTGVILPKILQIEPDLTDVRCTDVWKIVNRMFSLSSGDETNSNIFITLCGLVNYFIPCKSTRDDVHKISSSSSVIARAEFWSMIQSGLVHPDSLARKQAMFLLKRAIDWCSVDSSSGHDVMVLEEGDELPLFQWIAGKRKQLLGIWGDFFLLYETLAEVQTHVVQPVMPRLGKLIKAASSSANQTDHHPLLHPSWLKVIFHRSFAHETKTVVKWGVSQFLQIDIATCDIMHHGGIQFVLDFVIQVLLDDGLFIRQPNQPLGVCPSLVMDLKAFLQACVKVLPHPQLKGFMHDLLGAICGKKCGPVAIAFAMEALSELPRVPVWDQMSIKTIRQFIIAGLIGCPIQFRSVIECFLLKSALNLLDPTVVSVHHFSELLSTFSSDVCLRRGNSTWNEVCKWVVANRSTNLFNSDNGTLLQTRLSNELVQLLTVEDNCGSEDSDLPSPDEADRVARLLVIITDAHHRSIERGTPLFNVQTPNSTSILASVLYPLSNILVRISSHIYLSPIKADTALQVMLAILRELQPKSTLMGDSKDPTQRDFEDMIIQCTEQVLLYITRKLLSQSILQTNSIERVNFYVAILDAIYTFWHGKFTASSQGSYQQIAVFLRNTKAELTKSTLSFFEAAKTQVISIENQGEKVVFTSILLWLSTMSSGVTSSPTRRSALLDSLLTIKSVSVKTLPPPQNGQLVSNQDWGRIQSQLLQCKWSCICKLLEDRKDDVDAVLISKMCVADLQVVSGNDDLPILKCATMLMEQLLPIDASACIDLIEANWCIVQNKWRSLDFWPAYIAFVKLTFQKCLLQPGLDPTLADTIKKYTAEIFELGEMRPGIVNTLMSSMCKTWIAMLTESEDNMIQVLSSVEEHKHVLQDACIFGPVCNKGDRLLTEVGMYFVTLNQLDVAKSQIMARRKRDCGAIRATVLNFLLYLGMHQRAELNAYLSNFLIDLLSKDLEVASGRKTYIINSLIHRQKQRTWQTILLLLPWLHKDASAKLYDMTMQYLASENQTSVRYLMEWVLVRLLYRFTDLHTKLWQDLHVLHAGKRSHVCPLLIVLAHLAALQPTAELKEAFCLKAVPIVMPWSLAQTQSLRAYGQLALYKLWKDCTEQGLTRVLDAFPAVTACMQSTQNHNSLLRMKEKTDQLFFIMNLHPIEDYSIETIFHTLPAMSYVVEEELIAPSIFEHESPELWSAVDSPLSVTLHNSRHHLEQHRQAVLEFKAKENSEIKQVEMELHDKDVQKKIVPSTDIPGLEGLVLHDEDSKPKGSLVLVASLIDKPTNLGGLCRTSEIFGVSKLVIGSYRYMEDRQFTNLSVTADKWLPIEEVAPNDLAQYLSDMRHDGYTLVGVEQTANSSSLTDYQFPERTLLLLGNERGGIPVELIQLLDVCVEIPQLGMVRSLNVHVSGALLVWEYTRQRLLNIR